MKWFEIVVGVITAGAALGALFFAWRTVVEARAAAGEARRDHITRRLEDIVGLVAEIRLLNQNLGHARAEVLQARLRPLVTTIALEIPKTRELSERRFPSPNPLSDDDALASEALAELREAVRSLSPPTKDV